MFGASGSYSHSATKGSSKSSYWTGGQKKTEAGLGKYFQQWIDPKTGQLKPVAAYGGKLPGTYTPGTMSRLFAGAEQYAKGGPLTSEWGTPEGSQLFAHYKMYSDPAEREKRVAETLEARQRLLGPQQEKEDSLLRAQARAMGLSSSSDVLKKQMDVEETRRAETDALALGMLDKYEQMGYQASQDAMAAMQGIGQMQYSIVNAGLEAEFNEWLRQQPEYSPIIQQMMAYLGLQGVSETKSKESTTAYSASASYMSDERVKYDITDLTPIAFKIKEEYGGTGEVHIGAIAQEVERLFPHLIEEKEVNGKMVKHIDYQTLSAILLLALKARS